jgi:hypothetical protein
LVLSILRGELSVEEAVQGRELSLAQVEEWKIEFLAAAEDSLFCPSDRHSNAGDAVTMQTHDFGIWVCALCSRSLAPFLFMAAANAGSPPSQTSAAWNGVGLPRNPLGGSGAISLLHGDSSHSCAGGRLHLFTTKMTESAWFERKSALSDWRFPMPVAGVVVLLERREEDRWVRWLLRALKLSIDRTLAWVKTQELPFVVAAMGYDTARFSEDSISRRYGLVDRIPVVSGPPLLWTPQPRTDPRSILGRGDTPGAMSLLIRGRKLSFDPSYVKAILTTLCEQIAMPGTNPGQVG